MSSRKSLFALAALCAAQACSKSAGSQTSGSTAAATASAINAHSTFSRKGGAACDKYLTDDVYRKLVGATPTKREQLSPQSCKVSSEDGSLTLTLKQVDMRSFRAFQAYLSDPKPLPGVGDTAIMSIAPTVSAVKGSMGCDFDADGLPRGTALDRAKALGAICNKIFADAR